MLGRGGIALVDTGAAVLALVRSITEPRAPALGVWDTAGLSGHLLRAFRTPLRYLATDPAPEIDLESAAAYFAGYVTQRTVDAPAVDDAVATRGAAELADGADPNQIIEAYETTLSELTEALNRADPSFIVASPFGGIVLDTYLETRVFEATVHGLDLARALGNTEWTPPIAATELTLGLLVDLALEQHVAPQVILALTGRTVALPIVVQ